MMQITFKSEEHFSFKYEYLVIPKWENRYKSTQKAYSSHLCKNEKKSHWIIQT